MTRTLHHDPNRWTTNPSPWLRTLAKACVSGTSVIGMLAWAHPAQGSMPVVSAKAASPNCTGAATPGDTSPTPADPYPLNAVGWGPTVGKSLFVSRWAEDWTGMRAAGNAPPLKAMPLGSETSLTMSAETRLRYDTYDNGLLRRGNDYQQGLLRSLIGADLRFNPNLRAYGEVGIGQVKGRHSTATANFQNDASLQQLFIDARGTLGSILLGGMAGRQEFADGPRQLMSVSDGPNLHRTWNGARLYAHGQRLRLGAFDLRGTRLGSGAFDETINQAERLQGLNASLILFPGKGPNLYLDPFWFHTENPAFSSGGRTGLDDRTTFGVRLWGRRGGLNFDWTLARQTGLSLDRGIDAWGLFAVQSLALSDQGWKPRLGAHVDVASGGGASGSGILKGFNQLYASTNYLSEGSFLSSSNLLLIAPGLSLSPTSTTALSIEYGFARRLQEDDAAYAGQMRAYAGTQNVPGQEIGGLLRIVGTWSATEHLSLFFTYEHLAAGEVLDRAQLPSSSYGYVGTTFRY